MRTEERRRTEEKGSIGIGEAGARQPGIFGPWRWQRGARSAWATVNTRPGRSPTASTFTGTSATTDWQCSPTPGEPAEVVTVTPPLDPRRCIKTCVMPTIRGMLIQSVKIASS